MGQLDLPVVLRFEHTHAVLVDLGSALSALGAGQSLVINGQALRTFDSSALAVMLECQRQVRQRGGHVEWRAMPVRLCELARLYGMAELLKLDVPDPASALGTCR